MNLLDLYSKKLVEFNNKNKHEEKKIEEKEKDNNEDIKDIKLGIKNLNGPK